MTHALSKDRVKSAEPLQELVAAFGVSGSQRVRAAERLLQVVDARIEQFVAENLAPRLQALSPRYPKASLGGGIERAEQAGEQRKQAVLDQPEMLSAQAAAQRAGMSRQALDDRRKAGRALAHLKRGFRYPAWQFEDGVAGAMAAILPALSHLDPWQQYFFFVQAEPLLDGLSPLAALRAGKSERLLKVIEILRQDAAV